MVQDYMILVASASRDLTQHVRAAIAEGWQPQGGVAHTHTGSTKWAQAMVRDRKGPEFGDGR